MSAAAQRVALQAASLPSSLADLRAVDASGMVLATFERSAYLDLNGRIVALGSSDVARGPLVITLRHPGVLPAIAAGMPVHLGGGHLEVGSIAVDLREAPVWDPTLPLVTVGWRSCGEAAAVRSVVESELLAGAPDESVAGLLASRPGGEARSPHAALLASLARGLASVGEWLSGRADPATVSSAVARDIAGRGPGLTPSGDDLLVGIMIGVTAWPATAAPREPVDVRLVLASAAHPHTTRISGAYLDAALRGWAPEPWHDLIRPLAGARAGPPDALRAAVRRLLRIGETSGADALTGFCWAWRRLPA